MEVLDNIPFDLDVSEMLSRLRLDGDGEDAKSVRRLAATIGSAARPKAVYGVFYLENRDGDSLDIGGVSFTSRVLSVNLERVARVFVYVATCGPEMDRIAVPSGDPLQAYCLDMIKEKALKSALNHLRSYLKGKYALGQISGISPGSLPDWPLTEQKKLFGLLDGVEGSIGVKLTESCLMVPVKSVSGIIYPAGINFESCQLCPRENCRERRATYDPDKVREYGLE